ncbi:hypothetical protein J7M00_02865 [bacterium]|nr:hypothetical protein [bacterium]
MGKVEYTIFDALEALLHRWKSIIFIPLLMGILAVGIGFLLPKWYRAEAQVMPPYSAGTSSAISGLLGGIMGIGGEGSFTLPMMITPVDLWGAMVKSPGIADSIIEEFNLMERYHKKQIVRARKAYLNNLYVDISGEGILTIGYEDKDPKFSADVTNAIVNLLDRILQRVHTTAASRTRKFLEERLKKSEQELKSAENALLAFQQANKAVSLEDQAKVAVENIAQLYAQLSFIEIQLGAMENAGVQFSPEKSQLEAQEKEFRRKIKQLEQKGDASMLGIPIKNYPDLILEYARLYRDAKIEEIVYEMLRQQYEQARIEEQRNTQNLHILARAIPPDKKIRPKKALMGIATTIGVGAIMILWALWRGYLELLRKKDPEHYSKIKKLWRK